MFNMNSRGSVSTKTRYSESSKALGEAAFWEEVAILIIKWYVSHTLVARIGLGSGTFAWR